MFMYSLHSEKGLLYFEKKKTLNSKQKTVVWKFELSLLLIYQVWQFTKNTIPNVQLKIWRN